MTALKVLVCVLVLAVTTFAQEKRAIAYLEHTSNSNVHIYGYVTFVQLGDGYVTVAANIRGLPDGRYAMHVHEFGDLTNYSGSSAGPHFVGNGSVSHGCPYSSVRHAGDMGTWNSTSGLIQEEKYLDLLQLSGNFSVIGRAVVLHSTFDSCTGDSGNAGSRIAFGTIGIQNLHDSQAATDFVATLLVAKLYGTVHCGFCSGFVFFNSNLNETTITVTAYVNGLIGNTVHGIHIHEYGDLTFGDGSYLGAHWNPTGALHGLPIDEDRHAGDLGNVQNYDGAGVAWYQYNTTLIASPSNITGRGVVVHELSDKGRGFACSTANGHSGVRYIAGVIGIASNTTVIPVVPIEIDNTWADEDCEEMPEPISTHTTVIGLPEITSDIIIYTSINSSSMLNISIFVILASLALLM